MSRQKAHLRSNRLASADKLQTLYLCDEKNWSVELAKVSNLRIQIQIQMSVGRLLSASSST